MAKPTPLKEALKALEAKEEKHERGSNFSRIFCAL